MSKPGVSSPIGGIQLDEGLLDAEEVDLILRHLPFDVGFVDNTGELTYSNHGAASLPYASADTLAEHEDNPQLDLVAGADETVLLHGISTVSSSDGSYEGVLLFSQDVSAVRSLAGERRILDWD